MQPQRHKGHEDTQSDLSVENPVSRVVVDCAYQVHKQIGPGLLESAYEECLEKELQKHEMQYQRQHELPIYYDGQALATRFRVDFLVENSVIIELKSVEAINDVHRAQTLTYLRLSGLRLALLINFSAPLIKQGIQRIAL